MFQKVRFLLIVFFISCGTSPAWSLVVPHVFTKFSIRGKAYKLMSQSLEAQIKKLEKYDIKIDKCVFTTAQNHSLIDAEEPGPCLETKLFHDYKAPEKGRLEFLVSYKGVQRWATVHWKQDCLSDRKGLKKLLYKGGGHLFSLVNVLNHEASLIFHSPLPVDLSFEGLVVPIMIEKMDLTSGRENETFKTTVGIQSQNLLATIDIFTNISIPFIANNYLSEKKFTSLVLDTIPLKPHFKINMEQRKHD